MNSKIDSYLAKANNWQEEMITLRKIILECEVNEELKWAKPCYSNEGKNIAIMQPFKDYLALMFFKGALLKDSKRKLVSVGPNSQAAKQLRFTSAKEVTMAKAIIKAYINEAIKTEKAGLKVEMKKTVDYEVPPELTKKFKADPAYKKAFNALTPGRQRGYLLHFSAAKQAKTREARIDKCKAKILQGKGCNER